MLVTREYHRCGTGPTRSALYIERDVEVQGQQMSKALSEMELEKSNRSTGEVLERKEEQQIVKKQRTRRGGIRTLPFILGEFTLFFKF